MHTIPAHFFVILPLKRRKPEVGDVNVVLETTMDNSSIAKLY